MIHGILVHLGYVELANNEQFLKALGNSVYQGFTVKDIERNV